LQSDVQNGSLRTPISLSVDGGPLEDINRRIRSNREEQENYLTVLTSKASKNQNDDKKKKKNLPNLTTEDMLLEEKMEKFKREMAKRKKQIDEHIQKVLKEIKDNQEAEAKQEEEAKKGLDRKGKPDNGKNENGAVKGEFWQNIHNFIWDPPTETCVGRMVYWGLTIWIKSAKMIIDRLINEYQEKRIMLEQAARAAIDISSSKKIVTDDGLSALSADQYVRIRLLPMAASYSQRAPGLAAQAHVSAIVGVVLSVASSAMAQFDVSVFIPALLAFSGAVTAWNNYQQIDLRLLQTNSAVNKLNQVSYITVPNHFITLSLSLSLSRLYIHHFHLFPL